MTEGSEKTKKPRGRPFQGGVNSDPSARTEDSIQVPADWRIGALLNVRNHGEHYVITLWPEEYSPERENRCIKFTNLGECQGFASDWYSHHSHDPRAR